MSRGHFFLHLVLPDLLTHHALIAPELRLPALESVLSRAIQQHHSQNQVEHLLFELFDLDSNAPLPLAAMTRYADSEASQQGWWLRADPVYLQADRDRVLLFDADSAFQLSDTEATQFITELNQFFAEDGLHFTAATPTRWYLQLPEPIDLQTTPISDALGYDIHAHMPTGDAALQWRKYLNEIQMLLHQSPINQQREEAGNLPINSIWLWGGGKLPKEKPVQRFQAVHGNDVLLSGLAKFTDVPWQDAATLQTADDWLNQMHQAGDYLLMIHPPRGHVEDWGQWLKEIDDHWLHPLFEAAHKRQIETLYIYPCDQRVFCLTQKRARHWWRKRRNWRGFVIRE